MAVIIGCSPAFAVIIRRYFQTRNASSAARQYNTQQSASGDVKMKSMGGAAGRPRHAGSTSIWDDAHSSQEALAKDDARVSVATTSHQDDERGNHSRGN